MKKTGAPLTRVALTVVVMVSMLAVFGTTATAKPPPKPDKEQVAVCHYDAAGLLDPSVPLWKLLLVNPKAVDAHMAHGDGYPDGVVPGTDGAYVFDEYCVPQLVTPTETIFAVAYTDMVTSDGDYNADVDVLIAKLVDGNDNGVLDVGDTVITYQYPTSFAADAFDSFTVTSHVISQVVYAEITPQGDAVLVYAETTTLYGYEAFRFFDGPQHEFYSDGFSTSAPYDSIWRDNWGAGFSDAILARTTSPSQPATAVNLSSSSTTEDAFLDVDYVYDPDGVVIG